jgi:hypothetical protein
MVCAVAVFMRASPHRSDDQTVLITADEGGRGLHARIAAS